MDSPINSENYRRLVAQIYRRAGVIPFLGAGISIPCGMPGWTSFLLIQGEEAGVSKTVRAQLDANDFEGAAEELVTALSTFGFHAAIERYFGDHKLNFNGATLLPRLVDLFRGPVITTNFDRVVERAYEVGGSPFQQVIYGAKPDSTIRALQESRMFLLKLHGDWEERTDRIITRTDYRKHYGYQDDSKLDFTLPLPRLLRQIITGRSLLFIGCSLNQDRTIKVLRRAAAESPEMVHFALVEEPRTVKSRREKTRHLADHNILPIWYPAGRHDLIEVIITSLIADTTTNATVGLAPHSIASAENPFEYGRPVKPDHFTGRRVLFSVIRNKFGSDTAQCLSITGLPRSGKTSLLTYIRDRPLEFCKPEQRPIIVMFDMQDDRFDTPAGLLEGLKREIVRATGSPPWRKNDEPFEVHEGLSRLAADGYRLIILIDEFERIKRRIEVFRNWGADWRAKINAGLFVLGICSQRSIGEVYKRCGLDSPFDNVFIESTLGPFTEAEWHSLVREGFRKTARRLLDADLLFIGELSGGLPYFTQMATSLLWELSDHERTRNAFVTQAFPRFRDLWRSLTATEQHALRYRAGVPNLALPNPNVITSLEPHGLLRSDGNPFSPAFADFVRQQG